METQHPDSHRLAELEIAMREMRLHMENLDAFIKQLHERIQRIEKDT